MMEETANPTPSSATLAPEMPMGETKANTTSIKLLIKASNQQHDDQIIESDLLWTIHRLKTQLSLVYPSKPPVSEQKLIYSGQLLNDRAQLKDIIRSYKDVYTQHHILHLVYTPKNSILNPNKKMTPTGNSSSSSINSSDNSNNNDGLRQRNNISNSSNSNNNNGNSNQQVPSTQFGFLPTGQQQQQFGLHNNNSLNNSNVGITSTFTGSFDMQTLAAQQAAMYNWMWQTYGQYMQQFSQINAAQVPSSNSTTTNPLNPVIAFPNLAPMGFYPQSHFGQFQQQNQISTAAAAAVATAIPTTATIAPTQQAEPSQNQQQQQQVQQEAEAVAAPQPRFPNIVQEEPENRDWLDSFFSIMRLALFLTILYFNSSPMRCFMVFIIAGGIYLYHIGFFRARPERNNNDINRINNAAAAAAAAAAVDPAQQQQQQQENQENNVAANNTEAVNAAVSDENNITANVASTAAEDATVDNNSTTVIAFMRSFIVSFFTSLLPETPAAI